MGAMSKVWRFYAKFLEPIAVPATSKDEMVLPRDLLEAFLRKAAGA
jgi:hypothetical protein